MYRNAANEHSLEAINKAAEGTFENKFKTCSCPYVNKCSHLDMHEQQGS